MADHMAHRADGAVAHGKEMLARLLAFAPTTYLDWPDASAFRVALQVSMMRNLSSSFDPRTLLSAAAMQAGSGDAGAGGRAGTEVTLVTPAEAEGAGWWRKGGLASGVPLPRLCRTSLWRVRVEHVERLVRLPGQQMAKMSLSPSRPPSIVPVHGGRGGLGGGAEQLWSARSGVSLQTLGILRLVNRTRACLFRSALDLSLRADMHPLHLVALACEVRYQPLRAADAAGQGHTTTAVRGVPARAGLRSTRAHGAAAAGVRSLAACNLSDVEGMSGVCYEVRERDLALADALDAVLRPHYGPEDSRNCNFSFIEYGSGLGFVGTTLASLYPGSTMVSVESDLALHRQHATHLRHVHLGNNVACHADSSSVIEKLYESPEFVRFQMLAPLSLLTEDGKDSQTLGKLFSCAMTTFLRVPAPRLLAAILRAVYPEEASIMAEEDLALLVEALVQAAFVPLSLSSQVTATKLAEAHGQTLVRVNLLNMTRLAHHHFDYKRDGHARVYDMRFSSAVAPPLPHSSSDPERPYLPGQVRLTRREDDHQIPFGELRAVSLIALLRMGLDPSQRRRFYAEFVGMPLFEDMAPWNLVFVAGQLAYIDQDTQDTTFNEAVPRAYQTMSALMNYIRTVQDFGKCGARAKGGNQYGIPYISDCVGSDFRGPCLSSSLPVPCGDRTCRSTFVECLAALMQQEVASKHAVPRQGILSGVEIPLHVTINKQ
eukprot:Tamp_05389.p1 GENE.Tamp_05389~~Tamp_05389.p1  ORF type:complete len:825 (-),score=116.94 Tamp_05389:513-2654(-)